MKPSDFVDPHVRALAWAIGSPPLVGATAELPVVGHDATQTLFNQALPWLHALSRDPTPLVRHLEAHHSWRVGFFLEALFRFWLEEGPGYTLLGTNHVVQENKQTRGAFDFIVRNQHEEVEHWEITVKFYLFRGGDASWRNWVGPMGRDRLDLKLNRMAGHQLPLSRTKAGADALAKLGVFTPPTPRAFVKGILFTPWNHGAISLPEGASPPSPWVYASEFDTYAASRPTSRWVHRSKPDWLSPFRSPLEPSRRKGEPAPFADPRESFDKPEMWSRMEEHRGEWTEAERLFLLPDGWWDTVDHRNT